MSGKDKEVSEPQAQDCCASPGCCNRLDRRSFLKAAGLGLAASTMAGPFERIDAATTHPIPVDKKLDPAWIKALEERE